MGGKGGKREGLGRREGGWVGREEGKGEGGREDKKRGGRGGWEGERGEDGSKQLLQRKRRQEKGRIRYLGR